MFKFKIQRIRRLLGVITLLAGATVQAQTPALSAPEFGFAVIKTSQVPVAEALLKPGGSLSRKVNSNFSAFLIKHGADLLLFDTGMGSKIDAQYQQDMPLWARPFFNYEAPVRSARQQLDAAGVAPLKRVLLSHSHWDHAGGVADFPEAEIGVAAAELALIRQPSTGPGGTWASQIAAAGIRWQALAFNDGPIHGYPASLDLFQDGRVVLVPMPGHTPGSMGLFLTVDSGTVYFFIGDVAWTVDALKAGAPKFWAAGLLVDGHAEQTQASAQHVRELLRKHPAMVVVPAHDSTVPDGLGYFPAWVR